MSALPGNERARAACRPASRVERCHPAVVVPAVVALDPTDCLTKPDAVACNGPAKPGEQDDAGIVSRQSPNQRCRRSLHSASWGWSSTAPRESG